MLQNKTSKKEVFTFKRFANKKYSAFCSLKREVRIGCLSICMLTVAHNASLASRTDSLQIISQQKPDKTLNEIVVSGSLVPVAFEESANKVSIITRQDIENAKVQSINDLLKLCAGVDVRQRGAFGVQTDIGIGGGTFDQVSILINGISINNPQTGHLSADFPVAIQDIERIEVYDGASARAFGSQALNGAINIITKCENNNQTGIQLQGGSYGTAGGGAYVNLNSQNYSNRLSGDYLRSDGATHNSDFQKIRAFYQGNYKVEDLSLQWQTGYNYQRYGANTFYSAKYPNQWERNNRVLASVKALTNRGKIHFQPILSWVRSYDHFQLIRGTHTAENFHRNDVFTSGLNAYTSWALGRTAIGGEIRYEGILSTNLGKPLDSAQYVKVEGHDSIYYNHRENRTNIDFFLEHVAIIGNFTFSGGVMANRNTDVNERFSLYPGVDLSYHPLSGLKIFASWNKSMRLPTFTDLFYKSPTQQGNIGLKPEKTSTFKVGMDYQNRWFSTSIQGIYRCGTDMIDWVMYSADDIFHSAQFKLDNYELLSQTNIALSQLLDGKFLLESFNVAYTYNYQRRHDDMVIYKSNYALEYLRHKLTISLNHHIYDALSASWYFSWQKRMGGYLSTDSQGNSIVNHYVPYGLLNLKINWKKPRYDIYLSLENLTNHTYYDFGSIPQPGFTFLVGASFKLDI